MFLDQRHLTPEVMDQPGLDARRHAQALEGLARINFWSGSARILWRPLRELARRLNTPLRVLDVATGAGDVPVRLARKARRAGLDLELEGCDVSPVAIDHARARASRAGEDVRFFVHDALDQPFPGPYHAVVCSLFLHHLDGEQARDLLRRMADAASHLVLANDLVRSWPGLLLAHVGVRVFSTSPVVHTDGPRSVEGAFRPAEARGLAEEAGLHGATVERRWPCRYLLTWSRP
jgi:SAM-dependent methyltransferase